MSDEDKLNSISTDILFIKNSIERMVEKQDEMVKDLRDVKSAIYNPDSGLYARIKDTENRIQDLEEWQDSQSKIQMGIIMTVISLVVATLYKLIIQT